MADDQGILADAVRQAKVTREVAIAPGALSGVVDVAGRHTPGEPVVVGLRVRGQDYGLVAGPAGDESGGSPELLATVDGRTLDSAAAGGFLGLWLGVHATSEGRPTASVVRVERFAYEPVG